MSEQKSVFKVIIVGGRPVGLAAAHALHLAGIDFLVPERRPAIVEDKGASLIVHPHTLRVLRQFDVLEELLPRGVDLHHHLSFTAEGYVLRRVLDMPKYGCSHGYGPVAFHHAELIEVMYKGLPPAAREKVLTDKKLVDVRMKLDGVQVTCADGSAFEGSMVIGADDVHSKTRQLMRTFALKTNPTRSWDSEQPYTAAYPASLLFISVTLCIGPREKDKAIIYFSSADQANPKPHENARTIPTMTLSLWPGSFWSSPDKDREGERYLATDARGRSGNLDEGIMQ
ncbi:FAD-dependent monooxygenase andE [Talaromyces pinophilus]|nr:FAD-dependent monooxygenase andE [Talaromyces pinophilus]